MSSSRANAVQELIVIETYEDEPSSFLSGKAAWNNNMKVISCSAADWRITRLFRLISRF